MRVGIDAHMIGDHSGGNESFYTNIINNMNPPKNMEIILFVKKGADLSALTNKFKRIEFQESSALKRNFFELPKLCKEYELDLLHTQYFIPFNRPCPVVCTIHDICFEHYSNIFTKKEYYTQKLLIPYAAKKSKAVFTVSNHAKQDIASHYHIPESNLVVTYNAVNQNFRKLNEEELNESELRNKFDITGNRIILSVGNLQPRKNLPRLMRAFVKLKKDSHFSDVQLVVVGKKAWMFDDIMKESADNNKDIILTDYVSNEDLVRLYNLADGFVYPSFYEGFGIPPLEAMACGTPVAVANATSLPEVVGDAGMYFDPFSEEEITNSIVKLLDEDKAIRDEKRIERVNCFNWQDSANAMFSKYIEVVEFASGCCILMNKNVIEKVGMLDESYFMYYEDTDFCARLKKETIDIVYVPTAKIWHKVGASSSGEYSKFTAYYMAKNRLKFISKYSHNNLQRAYLRTIASGIKGYILNRNSKVSIKALKDFIKEQRT